MPTIAITGASGFIGRALVRHVDGSGHVAVPLSRRELESDIAPAIGAADVVVHLAGRAHVLREAASDPRQAFHASNVELTREVLDAARRAGARRFVLMSSAGVLGNVTPAAGLDDDSPPAPHDEYSRSKLEAERLVRSIGADAIEVVIVRPPVVYGPGAPGNFARILGAVRQGLPLPIGRLEAPRSMIGLRNLCDFILRASLHPATAGATMLASEPGTVSVRDLAVAIGQGLNKRARIFPVPVPVLSALLTLTGKSADVPRLVSPFVVRASRARALMDWRAPYSFQEEIRWTVANATVGP